MSDAGQQTWSVPHAALDLVADGVLLLVDGEIRAANVAASRLLGQASGSLVGRGLAAVIRPVEADAAEAVAALLAPGGGQVRSLTLRAGDGREVHVRARGARVDGQHVVVLHDVTEQLETQAVLAQLQARMDELQQLGRVGMWTWDPVADEVQWTAEMHAIHGVDPLTFGGDANAHLALVVPDDRPSVEATMRRAREDGEAECEYSIVRPDRGQRHLWSRAVSVETPRPLVSGVVQDVTVMRRALARVERANAQLEQFASSVAHDLRDPLGMISSYAALLLEEDFSADEVHHFLGRIRANAQAASEHIRELLAEARALTAAEDVEAVDLADLVEWVTQTLRGELEATDSTVATGELAVVDGRPAQLRQVLLNLVGNAIKYREPDRPAHVTISAVEDEQGWEVRVEDDGPGVPVGERQAVFDVGYRSPAHRGGPVQGTGIGLATVHANIVDGHGGNIWIADSEQGGAAVVFTLPRRRTREVDAP